MRDDSFELIEEVRLIAKDEEPSSRSADILGTSLRERYIRREAVIGIVGMGYVGMPLALAAIGSGFRIIGLDIDLEKVTSINSGKSYLRHIPSSTIAEAAATGSLKATVDFSHVAEVDAIIVCVPTPLTAHREPDLTYVEETARAIAPYLRRGHLIVLESTTWPGTTDEIMRPILEEGGMKSGRDFFLAFSPEREDPGNPNFSTEAIPKVVGADDPISEMLVAALYGSIVKKTVPVSSTRTAEAVKLTENIFRSVNIALVNELKIIYEALGIDVWEVIDAASTKPFGFMPFYPGPGLGGHCIPIDPFYLTWKAREHEVPTRFIELAGEINTAMPMRVLEKVAYGLDTYVGRGLRGASVLLVGMAYKKNVTDIRESPALKLMDLLERRGARTSFFDPYVDEIPVTREHPAYGGRRSIAWDIEALAGFDVALIVTDHDAVDYDALSKNVPLVVDTRNVCARKGVLQPNIIKA
jgi:UDP-N-acetyl-D-glucosamine dehydrogenase